MGIETRRPSAESPVDDDDVDDDDLVFEQMLCVETREPTI
jgi:hypothetical protein